MLSTYKKKQKVTKKNSNNYPKDIFAFKKGFYGFEHNVAKRQIDNKIMNQTQAHSFIDK